tara:strand:+ start:63 stop:1106 length:1044 start_codon:yes stop_codon:yes gene_type:complete
MNKIIFFLTIIVFLFKTGNVFSNTNIFNVDNIIIINNKTEKREKLVDKAIKKGFEELFTKILLDQDTQLILKTQLKVIQGLVSSYQINKNESLNDNDKLVFNISFDKNRVIEFLYKNNLSYADTSVIDLVLFPVLLENGKFYIYSNNFFYNNWNENKESKNFINYILPLENLDDIEFINKNKKNLESVDVNAVLSNYDLNDKIFLIIESSNKQTDVFLKGTLSGNQVVKNIIINQKKNDKITKYYNTIETLKFEISEIWKSQNLIDVRTPSFLNIELEIKKNNDFLILQKKLNNIDLIQNIYVEEINKNYVKIKIKYLGKINKMKDKLKQKGIDILIKNNKWKLKII